MKALCIETTGPLDDGRAPLVAREVPDPEPGEGEVLLRVGACGVCHTELDEIEGRLGPPRLPLIPGHQVVGRVEALGPGATGIEVGARVGVAWIYSACGQCEACRRGQENLCPSFRATGLDAPGGYAERMVARADFVVPIPEALSDTAAAPLLCAGAIGYRALSLTHLRDGEPLGLMGFGASGHLSLGLARLLYPRSQVLVFARSEPARRLALELGATWVGGVDDAPPVAPRAIVDTTPAWGPVLAALEALAPGGTLVVNAIRKEARDRERLSELDYPRHLWREKVLRSVANVTRADVRATLALAARAPGALTPVVETAPLAAANEALRRLRSPGNRGAKVLLVEHGQPE